jgi:uncharacterized protein (TIGR03083 family)
MVITVSAGKESFDIGMKLPPAGPGDTGEYVRGMDLDYLGAIASDAERMAAAGSSSPTTRVPSCPDWDLAALCAHQGWVHRMATLALSSASIERPDLSQIPSAPAGHEAEFLREGVEPLLSAMRARKSDEPAWNFTSQSKTVGFWPRRQAHETLIHRWDAERALGMPSDLPAALATDGIDEWFNVFLPARLRQKDLSALGGSIHMHCTDVEGEWILNVADGTMRVEHGHAKGDVAARGPAQALLLMIWHRMPADDASLEVFGDRAVLDRWLELLK